MQPSRHVGINAGALDWKTISLASLGGGLEFYDFIIYRIFAKYIGQTFFPSSDPAASLVAAFAVFAIGYLSKTTRWSGPQSHWRPIWKTPRIYDLADCYDCRDLGDGCYARIRYNRGQRGRAIRCPTFCSRMLCRRRAPRRHYLCRGDLAEQGRVGLRNHDFLCQYWSFPRERSQQSFCSDCRWVHATYRVSNL
ncbi:hypothetical protein ACVIIW_007277 [Bradyrhizobium sp. USDA 4449]